MSPWNIIVILYNVVCILVTIFIIGWWFYQYSMENLAASMFWKGRDNWRNFASDMTLGAAGMMFQPEYIAVAWMYSMQGTSSRTS